MAELKPSVKPATSVQVKKSGNAISLLAPVVCIIAGYVIWRFLLGNESGFTNLTLQKARVIQLPDEILLNYLTPEALVAFKASGVGIVSVTVYAEKPADKPKVKLSELGEVSVCCTPGGSCC